MMRISIGVGGEVIRRPLPPRDVVDEVFRAEKEGFPAAWTAHMARGVDTLSVLAVAGSRTEQIELGVGVVPTYPRHPAALAQQAATIQALCGGRFTLGVGVSHKPAIEGMYGLDYRKPAAHMREYLSVLMPLLREGSVSHQGEFFRVNGAVSVPGASPLSVVVAALSPLMTRVAGELADGAITWLAGPRTVESLIRPELDKAAAGRPRPRVIAGLPVALADADAGRGVVNDVFARYAALENYQRVFRREGAQSPGDLAVVGTEQQVAQQLRRLAEAGVDELWATVFPVGDDPEASVARTRQFLRDPS